VKVLTSVAKPRLATETPSIAAPETCAFLPPINFPKKVKARAKTPALLCWLCVWSIDSKSGRYSGSIYGEDAFRVRALNYVKNILLQTTQFARWEEDSISTNKRQML
jgi:hypothetical protein